MNLTWTKRRSSLPDSHLQYDCQHFHHSHREIRNFMMIFTTVVMTCLFFSSFRIKHHTTIGRSLRTENFAPENWSCGPDVGPFVALFGAWILHHNNWDAAVSLPHAHGPRQRHQETIPLEGQSIGVLQLPAPRLDTECVFTLVWLFFVPSESYL